MGSVISYFGRFEKLFFPIKNKNIAVSILSGWGSLNM